MAKVDYYIPFDYQRNKLPMDVSLGKDIMYIGGHGNCVVNRVADKLGNKLNRA